MANAAGFWDWMAARYARQPIADEAAYQRKLEVTRGYLRPDMEVLEFGCGTGSTALLHAPHVARVTAIDVSANMLGIAREKAAAEGIGNVEFVQSGIDEWEAPAQTFDAVLGLSILHLVADKDGVMAKVLRLLKPGGVFVTSTACIGDMDTPYRLLAGTMRLLPFLPRIDVFTEDELAAALTDAGFRIDHRWHPGRNKAAFIVANRPPLPA